MRISLVLRAVATSWVAVIANASVGIFLTPYVLHRLGDAVVEVRDHRTSLATHVAVRATSSTTVVYRIAQNDVSDASAA